MKKKLILIIALLLVGATNGLASAAEVWTGNSANDTSIFRYDFDGNYLGRHRTDEGTGSTTGNLNGFIEAMVVVGIPEPSSLSLVVLSLLGIAGCRRNRKVRF